jgi:hypothetical protein
MFSVRFIACLDMLHHGLQHLFRDSGGVADSLAGIHNAMVKSLFVVNWSCLHKGFLGVPTGKTFRGFKFGGHGNHAVGPVLPIHCSW